MVHFSTSFEKKVKGNLILWVAGGFIREKHRFRWILKYRLSSALLETEGEIWVKSGTKKACFGGRIVVEADA
jgi:hypothetical protein